MVSWFPDGQRAVVALSRGARQGRLALFSLANSDSLQVILAEQYLHALPALSPNGKLLAFTYAEPVRLPSGQQIAGTMRIAIYRFADGARVSPVPATGTNPVWSADGRTLFFQNSTGTIYKAAVHDSTVLAMDRPLVATPYKTTTAASRFAVLPGDTAFVVRTIVTPPRVVAPPVPEAIRGRRATDRDQRELELVAAREVVWLAAQQNRGFEKFALDTRVYRMSESPGFAGFADSAKSFVLAAHTESHMKELAKTLRVAGMVTDSATCVSTRPTTCRMLQFPGIVAMSPAIVSADSALLSVTRTERTAGAISGATAGYNVVIWHVTMARKGNAWVVREVVRFP
jgi:hypothetical protein